MNTKLTILILLLTLCSARVSAQANINIPFNRIVLYSDFNLIESSNGQFYELENYKQSDAKLELDEYKWGKPNEEIDPKIDGFNSFQKQYIGTEPLDDLIKVLQDKKKCLLCMEEDEYIEENSEWFTLDEDEVLKAFTINGTYHFLIGYYGLVFKYKEEIIVLYDGSFCQLSEINCDFEEKGNITFGKLAIEKTSMGKVDFVELRNFSFYSKDSIYSLNGSPDFEISYNNKYTYFEKSVRRAGTPRKAVTTEGSQFVEKESFLEDLKSKSFCYEYGSTKQCIQHFNENIFVHYRLLFEDEAKTELEGIQIKKVFPILIDNTSTSFTFGLGGGHLFLKKSDGSIINHYNSATKFSLVENIPLSDEIITEIKLSPNSYRTVETKTGYGLKDYFSEKFYIAPVYDTISVLGNFIVAKQKEQIYFFDKFFKKIDLDYSKVRDYYRSVNNLQILYGNELFWLDQKGNLLKEFTAYKPEIIYACDCCGPHHEYKYSINQEDTNFFTLIGIAEDHSVYPSKELKKETMIVERDSFDSMRFLNRSEDKPVIFQQYDRFFPKGMTFIFSKENKKGLFAKVTDNHNVHLKNVILISGVDEFFPKSGILEPIKFRIGNKFGFYPLSQTANYLRLNDFDYGFARVKFGGGKEGWVNLNGKEFFDQ